MPVIELALIVLALAPPGSAGAPAAPGFRRIGPAPMGQSSGRPVATQQVLVTLRIRPGCRIDAVEPPSCGSPAIAWREAVTPGADAAQPVRRTVEY